MDGREASIIQMQAVRVVLEPNKRNPRMLFTACDRVVLLEW